MKYAVATFLLLSACGDKLSLKMANEEAQRFAGEMPNVISISCSNATNKYDTDGFCHCTLIVAQGSDLHWIMTEGISCACVPGKSGCYK